MKQKQFKKLVTRFSPILLNGFRSILNPVYAIAFSYVIVTYFSKELWGNFVEYLLFFFIVSLISNWGSKTYLMRAFSQSPKNIVADWQELFLARLPICLVCVTIVPFIYELSIAISLSLWILSAYIYISFLPIVFYNRDYKRIIFIETIGFFALIIQLVFYKDALDLTLLIRSYAISIVIKVMACIIYYNSFLKFKHIRFNPKVLKLSFPFFLLGISGFLQSKIDIYAYSLFFEGKPLGEYQIISGFIIFSQSVVMLLMFPYIKNVYRMTSKSINSLKKNIAIYGFILNTIIMICIYIALLFFDIELTLFQLILGFIIGYPCYIYTLDILIYFKTYKEKIVILISGISLTINFLLSIVFLYLNYNITGVLAANAIAQIFALSYYLWLRKKHNPVVNLKTDN